MMRWMLAKTLEEGIRGVDLAARIGGDEFALVLPETDAIRGLEIGDRLRRAIKATKIPTAGSASTRITQVLELWNLLPAPNYE